VSRTEEVTRVLQDLNGGDAAAGDRLMSLVHAELRQLAGARMLAERSDHTLQPTALVHEAWLRLQGDTPGRFESRAHFFAAAGRAMRRILVDHARARAATKRGGAGHRVTLDLERMGPASLEDAGEVTAVDLALAGLERLDPRKARVVELRAFVGLSVEETAEALGLSPTTVKRDWQFARAWLYREIQKEEGRRA